MGQKGSRRLSKNKLPYRLIYKRFPSTVSIPRNFKSARQHRIYSDRPLITHQQSCTWLLAQNKHPTDTNQAVLASYV